MSKRFPVSIIAAIAIAAVGATPDSLHGLLAATGRVPAAQAQGEAPKATRPTPVSTSTMP
jgi:hypothetical protein